MMKTIPHVLAGYDPETEELAFERPIPQAKMAEIKRIVAIDEDDPNAIDMYALSREQAQRIARLAGLDLPTRLDFFLEPFGADRPEH